jgi:hypothetical protein
MLASVLCCASAAPAATPLRTGFMDPETLASPEADLALGRMSGAGATTVRVLVNWTLVAPVGTQLPTPPGEPRRWAAPAGFDATNPADPAYRWSAVDSQVRGALAHGLEPLLCLYNPPLWAEDPEASLSTAAPWYPDAAAFGQFATAAARRYSGSFGGLPRVRWFQAWNEPNLSVFFNPQVQTAPTGETFAPGNILSADLYRGLANAMADAVHAVHDDNLAVAGGLAPFTETVGFIAVSPLTFMRKLFCLSAANAPLASCPGTLRADVWTMHPYTSGGPTHHARLPDDVSLGDLPDLRRVLDAAVAAHRLVPTGPLQLWVTEFSWDSNPPDRYGVPFPRLSRWTAEALYRMWQSNVSLVTWFLIRDAPRHFASGLYYRGATFAADRPKPSLAAFRFPFVAFPSGKRIYVWGRTPKGTPAAVLVEQQNGKRWKKLGTLRTDANGIFQARYKPVSKGVLVRARTLTGGAAVPFSLRAQPDVPVNPFGDAPAGEIG